MSNQIKVPAAKDAKEEAKHAHADKAEHAKQEGSQGSHADLELKKKLAEQVAEGADLRKPKHDLHKPMPDLNAEAKEQAKAAKDKDADKLAQDAKKDEKEEAKAKK